ncbi:MAG: DUF2971 domain-containing protein [Thermoplasmata archaeon]|nr:DUF2971 domain-containing protein [Thermoplasmata archaeon]
MNDSTEVDHLYNVIYPIVKEKIIAETPSHLLNNAETVFNLIESNFKLRAGNMPYCICFSDNGDLLSQWCMYADKGTGVSIGFDFDYFKIKNEPPHPNVYVKNSIGLESIIYDYNLQASILYGIIKQYLPLETPNTDWIYILGNLTRYSATFKNYTFYAEKEKRFIYYFDKQHTDQFNENFLSGPYNYDYNGGEYYRFELSWFSANDNHAISKILLGPKCQKSSSEILETIEKYGVRVTESQIFKSESSYR